MFDELGSKRWFLVRRVQTLTNQHHAIRDGLQDYEIDRFNSKEQRMANWV